MESGDGLHKDQRWLQELLYRAAGAALGRDGESALSAQSNRDKITAILYSPSVSSVMEIIEAVKRLDERQKSEFLEKLAEIDFEDAWDRQIEADAKAGRLDPLWQQALEDIKAGRVKPLDEVIGDA